MALSRKDDITPEEQLLRLIEKPSGLAGSVVQSEGAVSNQGVRKGYDPKRIIGGILSLPFKISGLGKRISLKTVNIFCGILIIALFGYAIWSVVSAETLAGDEPDINIPGPNDLTAAPDIKVYYDEINKRSIFIDMYKPPVVEISKTPAAISVTVSAATEIKPVISEALKNIKLIGIVWEPQSVASGLVLIDDGSEIRCLARSEMFRTKLEQAGDMKYISIEVKEIFKNKVLLKYEGDEQELVLKD